MRTFIAGIICVTLIGCGRRGGSDEQPAAASAPISISAGKSIDLPNHLKATVLYADDAPGGSQVFIAIDSRGDQTLELPKSALARFKDGTTAESRESASKHTQALRFGRNIISIHVPHPGHVSAAKLTAITVWGHSLEVPEHPPKKPVDASPISGAMPEKGSK